MTRRYRRKKNKTHKNKYKNKNSRKWTTAFESASNTLKQTGSLAKAKESLKKQALLNARKLFGSV